MEITFTHHAISRFGHRGIRKSDLHLIAEYGSIAEQGMLLTRKDIASAGRSARKRLLDRLWKLQGVSRPNALISSRWTEGRRLPPSE